MAKRTASRALTVYRAAPAPPPRVQIVRVQSPAPVKHKSHRRRGGGGGGGGGGASMQYVAAGGLVLGLVEKSGIADSLPTIPLLGKTGTLAAALYAWSRWGGGKSRLWRDLAAGATAVAAYQLGKEGSISGE